MLCSLTLDFKFQFADNRRQKSANAPGVRFESCQRLHFHRKHSRKILGNGSPAVSGSRNRDCRLILDAERLAIQNKSVDAVVASLGDPYNTSAFWRECARVVRPGGRVLFTTPAFAWAHSFREETGMPIMAAEFDLAQERRQDLQDWTFEEWGRSEAVRLPLPSSHQLRAEES